VRRQPTRGVRLILGLLLVLAAAATGCPGGGRAKVRGKVTYKGTPLTMGKVILVSEDGKVQDTAPIQPDGTFEMDKAPTGKVKVGVANPPPLGAPGGPPLTGSPNDEETKQARAIASKFVPSPQKYTDPDKSNLTATVNAGSNELNLDLAPVPGEAPPGAAPRPGKLD
jgi:hypothetical protein